MKPKIFIGSTPADLETSLTVIMRSPVFNEDDIPGSYVFDFSVTLTPALKKEINFSNLPGASDFVFEKTVQIVAGAFNIIETGTLKTTADNKIDISMPINNSVLKQVLGDKKLPELDVGSFSDIIEYKTHAKTQFAHFETWEHHQHTSPVYQLRFNPVYDPHNTISGHVNQLYVAPASEHFTFSFFMNYKVDFGKNFTIEIKRNQSVILFSKTYAEPTLDQTLSDFITFSWELQQGDTLEIFYYLDSMEWPHHEDPDVIIHRCRLTIYQSQMFCNSPYTFTPFVDRGYPYNLYTFLPVFNNNFFANASSSVFQIDESSLQFTNEKFPFVNFYDQGFPMFIAYSDDEEAYFTFNVIAPKVFLAHIVKTLFEEHDIEIENNLFTTDMQITQLLVYAHGCINNISSSTYNQVSEEFELSKTLPEINCLTFLAQVCKTLGIVFQYNTFEKKIRFESLDNIMEDLTSVDFSHDIIGKPTIKVNPFSSFKVKYDTYNDAFVTDNFNNLEDVNLQGEVDTIGELNWATASINDCYYVKEVDAYYAYIVDEYFGTPFWRFYSLRFDMQKKETLIEKSSGETFSYTLPAKPIMMRSAPPDDPSWGVERKLLVPGTNLPGRIKGIKTSENQQDYYLLFYRGLQQDSNGDEYPLGSNAYRSLEGPIDFSNYLEKPLSFELNTDDENSIFLKRLRKYLHWRTLSPGQFTFIKLLESHRLVNFDFFRWYRIHNMDYLIREIKFEISKDGISACEIIAVPRVYIEDYVPEDEIEIEN